MSSVAGNSIITILLLALLGFLIGSLLAGAAKHKNKKSSVVSDDQMRQQKDEETMRQLVQIKQQLDSGLLTKEEYQEKRSVLLKE